MAAAIQGIKGEGVFPMIIYFVSIESHNIPMSRAALFSYYGLEVNSIPFRKISWREILDDKKGLKNDNLSSDLAFRDRTGKGSHKDG